MISFLAPQICLLLVCTQAEGSKQSACQVHLESGEEKAREQEYNAFIPPPHHPFFFFLYCERGESQEKAWNKHISYSHILFASSDT